MITVNTFDGYELKGLMDKHRLTIAVAESLTSGNVQAMIGSISGASTFFEGGITAYNLKQKVQHLGVNEAHASQVDSVSERVAVEMAKGVCLKFNADLGIGTTGYSEPYPAQNVTSPYAYFAIWRQDKNRSEGRVVAQELVKSKNLSRTEMQQFLTETVLTTLLDYLRSI